MSELDGNITLAEFKKLVRDFAVSDFAAECAGKHKDAGKGAAAAKAGFTK